MLRAQSTTGLLYYSCQLLRDGLRTAALASNSVLVEGAGSSCQAGAGSRSCCSLARALQLQLEWVPTPAPGSISNGVDATRLPSYHVVRRSVSHKWDPALLLQPLGPQGQNLLHVAALMNRPEIVHTLLQSSDTHIRFASQQQSLSVRHESVNTKTSDDSHTRNVALARELDKIERVGGVGSELPMPTLVLLMMLAAVVGCAGPSRSPKREPV